MITVTSPVMYLIETSQDSQQKQKCSQACERYTQELQTAWREMHRLHHELVQIEADKMNAIEAQLTDEQLTQLRNARSQPSTQSKSAKKDRES